MWMVMRIWRARSSGFKVEGRDWCVVDGKDVCFEFLDFRMDLRWVGSSVSFTNWVLTVVKRRG
jgi:hypothetical protein